MKINFSQPSKSLSKASTKIGAKFTARFDSYCAYCRGEIYEGDVVQWYDGDVMHRDCAIECVEEDV